MGKEEEKKQTFSFFFSFLFIFYFFFFSLFFGWQHFFFLDDLFISSVMAKVVDCGPEKREFELQLSYYV